MNDSRHGAECYGICCRYLSLLYNQAQLYPLLVTNKHVSSLALTSVTTAVRLSLPLFSVFISFSLLGPSIISRVYLSHLHLMSLLATLQAYDIDGGALFTHVDNYLLTDMLQQR